MANKPNNSKGAKKEKKIVKIEHTEETKEKYALDENRKIIKVEDKGDRKERAKTKRILAIVLWVLAIACEVLGILKLTDKLNLFPNIDKVPFLIGAIVLDLAFFIPGSLLWKKANHIDPISEKNKVGFWCWNNLGTILSVLAFLPIIIFVLTNKDLDKKDKSIVSIVAVIALVIAGVASYDFNPVSKEKLSDAEKEVKAAIGTDNVYWAKNSKKYHVDPDCPSFSRSEEVYQGTVADAYERNITEPCRRCIDSLEHRIEHATEEVVNETGEDKVYWTDEADTYSTNPDCKDFEKSKKVYEGTVKDAFDADKVIRSSN